MRNVLLASVFLALGACSDAPPIATGKTADDAVPSEAAAEVKDGTRCFLSVTTSGDGSIVDSMSVQLTFSGDHVSGRSDWWPGAKDRMRGTLEGTVDGDTITALYTYTAEGTTVTEQRILHLGNGYVAVLTGEMEERNGIWTLKDPAHAAEGMKVPEINCR